MLQDLCGWTESIPADASVLCRRPSNARVVLTRLQFGLDEATAIELAKVQELSADGTAVVLMGDMNEKDEFYCTVAAALPSATFANGGSYSADGCVPPEPTPIDWMVGMGMSFTDFYKDTGKLSHIATDHPIYSVTAVLD